MFFELFEAGLQLGDLTDELGVLLGEVGVLSLQLRNLLGRPHAAGTFSFKYGRIHAVALRVPNAGVIICTESRRYSNTTFPCC